MCSDSVRSGAKGRKDESVSTVGERDILSHISNQWTGTNVGSQQWYENGNKKGQGYYKNKAPIGKHILWHSNGNMRSVMHFISGRPHGLRTEWYDNGQKKEEGNFINGEQQGRWTYYNKDGTLDGTEDY